MFRSPHYSYCSLHAYGTLATTPAVECGEFWHKCTVGLKSKLGTFWKYGKVFVEFLEITGSYFDAWKPDLWNKLCFTRNDIHIQSLHQWNSGHCPKELSS